MKFLPCVRITILLSYIFAFSLYAVSLFFFVDGVHHNCEVKAPRYLSSRDREELCRYADKLGDSPAECAHTLKPEIHSVRNAILAIELCSMSGSIAPAQCYNRLPKFIGKEIAMNLCKHSQNSNPAVCASSLGALKGKKSLQEEDIGSFCTNFNEDVDLAIECLTNGPRKISIKMRLLLCRHVTSTHTVNCAENLLKQSVKEDIIAEVCQQAVSDGPSDCFMSDLRGVSDEEKAMLCRKAPSIDPVSCFKEIKSKKLSIAQKISVCEKAPSTEPGKCINKLPNKFSIEEKLQLCTGATTSDRLLCVEEMKQDVQNQWIIALCKSANSSYPATCFNKLGKEFSDKQKMEVCRQAKTNAPLQCALEIQKNTKLSLNNIVDLCHGSLSLGPVDCYKNLPFGISDYFGVMLCRNAKSNAPSICVENAPNKFLENEKVLLCQQSESMEPANCASIFNRKLNNIEIARLCSGATSDFPSKCGLAAPSSLIPIEIIELCSKATSLLPIKCMESLHQDIPVYYKISICKNAVSLVPPRCANRIFLSSEDLNESVIAKCRKEQTRPTGFEIRQFTYNCRVLIPRCKFYISLQLIDQFDRDIEEYNTRLKIKISSLTEYVTDELVQGVTEVYSQNGSVYFEDLTFKESGNFKLYITSPGLLPFTIQAHVKDNAAELTIAEICTDIFKKFKLPLLFPQENRDLWIVYLSSRFYLHGLSCGDRFEESGISLLGIVGNNLVFSEHYLSFKLLTGIGIPKSDMTYKERLGLFSTFDELSLRKAYRKQSLDWHPDRWSKFSKPFRRHAERIFNLISEAYKALSLEIEPRE